MTDTELCPLCGRPLGRRIERHHVIPKSKGGREVVDLHPICHRKIHSVFSNTELARLATIDALKSYP
ncbi:MAG: HNH endonuclease, partial [Pseudomonadota bacterium]